MLYTSVRADSFLRQLNMETNLVYANGAVALTNSILVAKKFEKDHQHILRDIRNLMEGVSRIGDAPCLRKRHPSP